MWGPRRHPKRFTGWFLDRGTDKGIQLVARFGLTWGCGTSCGGFWGRFPKGWFYEGWFPEGRVEGGVGLRLWFTVKREKNFITKWWCQYDVAKWSSLILEWSFLVKVILRNLQKWGKVVLFLKKAPMLQLKFVFKANSKTNGLIVLT